MIGAGFEFSPVDSSAAAFVCWLLAGLWAFWLYAEPRLIPALASRVAEQLPSPEKKTGGSLRVAAREVRGELRSIELTLARHRSLPLWQMATSPLPSQEWTRHRQTFEALDRADYDAVLAAYELANQINQMASHALKTDDTGQSAAGVANELDAKLLDASQRLERYAD